VPSLAILVSAVLVFIVRTTGGSRLFAGFNLINTGVLNCLIMCQNARKMHHSEAKIKIFSEDASPLPRPLPHWEGRHPLSKPHPPRRRLRAFGARPQTKVLDPPMLRTERQTESQTEAQARMIAVLTRLLSA